MVSDFNTLWRQTQNSVFNIYIFPDMKMQFAGNEKAFFRTRSTIFRILDWSSDPFALHGQPSFFNVLYNVQIGIAVRAFF